MVKDATISQTVPTFVLLFVMHFDVLGGVSWSDSTSSSTLYSQAPALPLFSQTSIDVKEHPRNRQKDVLNAGVEKAVCRYNALL